VLGEKTRVMGVLNVTPDSFSDGGNFLTPDSAVERALQMEAEGADIIDIGGESTRPGADPVSAKEEIARTVSVIGKLREYSDIPISIDTMKAQVAAEAVGAGADIINDVSAFEGDDKMIEVAAASGAGVVLMHMKGSPKTMQNNPGYSNVVAEVRDYLSTRAGFAMKNGIDRSSVVIDPGIGFGKTVEHNLQLLRNLTQLTETAFPVLIGASRKSLIGHLLDRSDPNHRLAGSLGIAAWALLAGTHILRVHDVIDTCDVSRILDTLSRGDP